MQIGDSSFHHFRRGHCLIDSTSSGFEHDGIKLHGTRWFHLLLRVSRFIGWSGIVLSIFQFLNTFALQQRARVIDITLYMALVAFDAHFIRVDLGLDLRLLLLFVL